MGEASKRGRPRDPAKLQMVLEGLSGDPNMFCEYGAPPYNVAHLAGRLSMDPANLRTYLLALECDGLVIRERRAHQIWNAIAKGDRNRVCLCFWSAATMERDRAAADAYRADSKARADAAWAKF
jgi:hypothetical protein